MLTVTIVRLETCCGSVVKRCIDAACKTNKDDACHADHQSGTLAPMALERGDWIVVRIDEHRLHYKQIVVEGDNRVEQCYEHEDVDGNASSLQRAGEDEELADELLLFFWVDFFASFFVRSSVGRVSSFLSSSLTESSFFASRF